MISTTGSKLAMYGQTDVGMARDHNEDTIMWDETLGFAILADGMGGHNAGEVASAMAVDHIKDCMINVLKTKPSQSKPAELGYSDVVRDAIIDANQEILQHAEEKPECVGMGTTLVFALFQNDVVIFANVGDSRIYRLREDKFEQITSDHSLVQEMVDSGYISQEEAKLSISRNLITRALGIGDELDIDIEKKTIQNGDIYLLCSDGLSDMVSNEAIQDILVEDRDDPSNTTHRLVNAANENGGVDNISVILVSIQKAYSDERGVED